MGNTEKSIMDAAEKEFLSKGFSGARTTVIAERAGVTHAMLHYYFRSKKHLFDTILQQKMELIAESIRDCFGNPDLPYMERLSRGVSNHFDFIAGNPDLPRFFLAEVISSPEYSQKLMDMASATMSGILPEFQSVLDKAAADGEIEKVDVRAIFLDMLSLNLFVFVALPVVSRLFCDRDMEGFLRKRKEENIELIMRRIRKA